MPSFSPIISAQASDHRSVRWSLRSRSASRLADTFWLISTNVDRKMASSDTISVSSPNGNLSNGCDDVVLKMIQNANQATCSSTNVIVLLNLVIPSAASCSWVRRRLLIVRKGELESTVLVILGTPAPG